MLAELFRVGCVQKRALVMVKPPGHLRRIRILEVDDHVFVAIKQAIYPGLHRTMGHPREMEVRIIMEAFPVKTIEERGGSGAIKATVVKAQADSGHERTIQAFR
jgi:hypothetical protein